jgi:hypothetical protein
MPAELKEQAMEYYRLANDLAAELLGWVEQHTPGDIAAHYSCPLSSMIEESHKTLLRVLHYPPFDGTEEPGAIRAAAHEDINLLTILPASNEPGLQVKVQTGSGWMCPAISAPSSSTSVTCCRRPPAATTPPPPTGSSTRPGQCRQVPHLLAALPAPPSGCGALRASHRPQLSDGAVAELGVI